MKNLLLFLFITLPILSTNAQKKTKESRPNIIFILTDDQPYDYLSVTGNKVVKTPHIDQLANQGTLFTT